MGGRGILGTIATAVLALLISGCALGGFRSFEPAPSAGVPTDRLFDVGVADFDEDGRLDLFTVNHKFAGAWLRNEGRRFVDVTEEIGTDPDPEFPSLDELSPPDMSADGLYIYMSDSPEGEPGLLHIRAVGVRARGTIGFLSAKLRVNRSKRARIRVGRNHRSVYFVRFHARPGAAIVLDPSSVSDAPMAASIDEPADLGSIRVGADGDRPESADFRLTLHDRHAIAFADLIGGPEIDAFVASGGLSGSITRPAFRGRIADELLSQEEGGFRDVGREVGLNKSGCRGRQSEPVDVNADGTLELFESCEERAPLLYRHRESGRFGPMGAPPAIGTAERWMQLEPGERPVLVSAAADGITVWGRRDGGFERSQRLAAPIPGDPSQVSLGDPDGDGDLDVLVVAPAANTMLRNDEGRLRRVPPGWAGVPPRSAAACFVDYDNDGRLDVHSIPQGLIRNLGDGGFSRTGQLRAPASVWATCSWADFDGDGLRDPLIGYGPGEFAPRTTIRRSRNVTPIHGHWLEVDLEGAAGNRQAIGASVVARAGGRSITQWVGQNDDSPHSQGHYRLYFGLGAAAEVDSLTVRWPDGERTDLGARPADQLIRLEQP